MKTDIHALREHLFAALEGLRDGTMEIEKAQAISEVSQTLINSAKVEIEALKVTGNTKPSRFLEPPPPVPAAGPQLRALAAQSAQGPSS